jgi:hypothetical protein
MEIASATATVKTANAETVWRKGVTGISYIARKYWTKTIELVELELSKGRKVNHVSTNMISTLTKAVQPKLQK